MTYGVASPLLEVGDPHPQALLPTANQLVDGGIYQEHEEGPGYVTGNW